jgi:hypothetical protein
MGCRGSIIVNISDLERKYLDEITTEPPHSFQNLKPFFFQIQGISKILSEKEKLVAEKYLMEDVLAGLNGQKIPIIFFIKGMEKKIEIYMGIFSENRANLPNQSLNTLITSLKGTYPDISISRSNDEEINNNLTSYLNKSMNIGVLTGIPTAKVGTEKIGVEQIERMIRGLFGKEWGFMVIAMPQEKAKLVATQELIFNEINENYPKIKKSVSIGGQYSQEQEEQFDKVAQYYVELLETDFNRYNSGKSMGMWNVGAYFFSQNTETYNKMGSLLTAIFSGELSKPDAIRTNPCPKVNYDTIKQFKNIDTKNSYPDTLLQHLYPYKFLTLLTSQELATFVHLPNEEMPGYDVKKHIRFSVNTQKISEKNSIKIGDIIDRGVSTHNILDMDRELLKKHTLIAGITGSGKTNTCFNLLVQLWKEHKIPFLVIEPTKAEYRSLIDLMGSSIRIFTLGNENIAPFRLNPFEIPKGVHIQRHLDNLKAIFNASFSMYPPMPYILEQCLINIYEKNGWNLTTNAPGMVTPTLGDLYSEIDIVVRGLGYHTEISMNVRAALRTRIRSLLLGGKGKMLNCKKSLPLEEILQKPTILELKWIGDDEEKSFLMGMLLGKIYEYREAGGNVAALQHITLIEEAHRLFMNIRQESEETNQSKAKAVETLCNILTEVRAYGEGIIIVDQVPTKLAPDAIKNTNMKLIHRTIAGDDRFVLAQSVGLSDSQRDYLINLKVGDAVAFFENLDEAMLLQIPDIKSGFVKYKSDNEISSHMNKIFFNSAINKEIKEQKPVEPFIGCKFCNHVCDFRFTLEPLINDNDFKEAIISAINEDRWGGKELISLVMSKVKNLGYINTNQIEYLTFCSIVQVLNDLFKGCGGKSSVQISEMVYTYKKAQKGVIGK